MVAPGTSPMIAERADVHKSCRALENVVNNFNDYCQATEMVTISQKKLSKSLRDASHAALKGSGDIAANALNAVAALFDALAEVDAKLVKIADRECEGVSAELKKWFKKLAKEEKNHDDKIATANAKIKQAGQAYEKKAKAKNRDASDEHTRYVNILSTVGPEMSQEKYNHALFVTNRQTMAIYAIASSLSRIADAEWARSCEAVRRFSPSIGQIGEYRAFLEGGWTGAVPEDLRDTSQAVLEHRQGKAACTPTSLQRPNPSVQDLPATNLSKSPSYSTEPESPMGARPPVPPSSSSQPQQNWTSRQASSTASSNLQPPSRPFSEQEKNLSVRSIESLSSFPSPPTHFPIPAVTHSSSTSPSTNGQPSALQESPAQQHLRPPRGSSGHSPYGEIPQAESPLSEHAPLSSAPSLTDDSKSPFSQHGDLATPPTTQMQNPIQDDKGQSPATDDMGRFGLGVAPIISEQTPGISATRWDDADHRNPWEDRSATVEEQASPPGKVHEAQRGAKPTPISGNTHLRGLERTGSAKSSGSLVAAMRDRFGKSRESASPPTMNDAPRLPQSVTDLASLYTPLDTVDGLAALTESQRPSLETNTRRPLPNPDGAASASSTTSMALATSSVAEDDVQRRRVRVQHEELEVLELERRVKERELALRRRELQFDQLLSTRGIEPSTPRMQVRQTPSSAPRPHSQYSYSMTNLVPSGAASGGPRPASHYDREQHRSQPPSPATDHAPYCGCHACSVAKYSSSGNAVASAHDARPPEPPITLRPEKPRGWMRRLSMPVVMSLDTKKNNSSVGLGSPGGVSSIGVAGRTGGGTHDVGIRNNHAPAEDGRIAGRKSFDTDATGGISNVRHRKMSFGRH